MTKHVLVTIEDLQQRETLEEISASVLRAISRFELTHFIIAGIPAPRLDFRPHIMLSNWDVDWLERYIVEGFVHIDPVVQNCLTTSLPFDWRDAPTHRSPDAADVVDAAKQYGMRYGYCVPLQLAGGVQGFASFGGPTNSVTSTGQVQLHLVALYLHDQLRKLAQTQQLKQRRRAITVREAEVLKLAALGKTAAEIAEMTGLSIRTVNQHCENAQRRLGTHNRIHTVVEAIRHKLITI